MSDNFSVSGGFLQSSIVTAGDVLDAKSAKDRNKIGNILNRIWDKIVDWFFNENRDEAKKCFFDLYKADSPIVKLNAYKRLEELAGAEYKKSFKRKEGELLELSIDFGLPKIENFTVALRGDIESMPADIESMWEEIKNGFSDEVQAKEYFFDFCSGGKKGSEKILSLRELKKLLNCNPSEIKRNYYHPAVEKLVSSLEYFIQEERISKINIS